MADYTLYGHPRSGNAYKTALMLSLTGTPYDFEVVDLMDGSNLAPAFLEINPLGKVPVLAMAVTPAQVSAPRSLVTWPQSTMTFPPFPDCCAASVGLSPA